jgi:hypothetical protein
LIEKRAGFRGYSCVDGGKVVGAGTFRFYDCQVEGGRVWVAAGRTPGAGSALGSTRNKSRSITNRPDPHRPGFGPRAGSRSAFGTSRKDRPVQRFPIASRVARPWCGGLALALLALSTSAPAQTSPAKKATAPSPPGTLQATINNAILQGQMRGQPRGNEGAPGTSLPSGSSDSASRPDLPPPGSTPGPSPGVPPGAEPAGAGPAGSVLGSRRRAIWLNLSRSRASAVRAVRALDRSRDAAPHARRDTKRRGAPAPG